jgi:hypothetical protein
MAVQQATHDLSPFSHHLSFVDFSSFAKISSASIAFDSRKRDERRREKLIGGANWDFFASWNWRVILHFHLVSFGAVRVLEYEIKLLYLITSHLLDLMRRENVSFSARILASRLTEDFTHDWFLNIIPPM